jgi:hypothetical protein
MDSGTTLFLYDVWGSSEAKDIFVVGEKGAILYYNGTTWSPMESGTSAPLTSVWGSSATDVFAAGTGGMLHYDGSTWSRMDSAMIVQDIWGTSATNVFAVGYEGTIYHYDGVSASTTTVDVNTTTTTVQNTTTTTSGGSCTSEQIYGAHSEEVEILRYIRDNTLSQTPEGKELIKLYYQWSPVIVKAMENDEEFKEQVKDLIDSVLGLLGVGVE